MFEVEAKVRLTDKDKKRLGKELPGFAEKTGSAVSKDVYYVNDRNFSMRVREKNGKGMINIKSRKKEKGIEINDELEIPVKDTAEFMRFLKKNGMREKARKEKKGIFYKKGKISIEFNNVKNLGYFLEIEILVKNESEIAGAKKSLDDIFKKLGFSKKDYEKKSYLQLLTESAGK